MGAVGIELRHRIREADAKIDPIDGRLRGSRSSFAKGVKTVPGPAFTGFRALSVADFERLLASYGNIETPTPLLPGFPDLVRYEGIEKMLKVSGVELQDRLEKLRINVANVECLSAIGRAFAIDHLKHLAADKPPEGSDAVAVAKFRDERKHAKANAADKHASQPKPPAPRRSSFA